MIFLTFKNEFISEAKEVFIQKKSILKIQQVLVVLIFIGMLMYYNSKGYTASLSIIPWIWGFLAGYIFKISRKRWLNEFIGLGILLAITIILFFKQTELIQLVTNLGVSTISSTVHIIYIVTGFILGVFLWYNASDT